MRAPSPSASGFFISTAIVLISLVTTPAGGTPWPNKVPGGSCDDNEMRSGLTYVHPSIKARFETFRKKRAKVKKDGGDLSVPDIFFSKKDGTYVYTRSEWADGSGFTDIEYVNERGFDLFVVLDCRDDPVEGRQDSGRRNAAERDVRTFLLEEGYAPVLGLTLGPFSQVRVDGTGPRARIHFRVGSSTFRATSPPQYRADPKAYGYPGVDPLDLSACPHMAALRAATTAGTTEDKSRLTVVAALPWIWMDGEGGGPKCSGRLGAITIEVSVPDPTSPGSEGKVASGEARRGAAVTVQSNGVLWELDPIGSASTTPKGP